MLMNLLPKRLKRVLAASILLFSWSVLAAQTLDQLVLVDASNNSDLRTLTDGDTVNLALDGNSLNIRADVIGSPGSVKFILTGAESDSQTEGVAPYALKGDSSGDYNSWTPSLGNYSLVVELYAGSNASGTLLDSGTFAFTVIDQIDTNPRLLTVVSGSGSGSYVPGTIVEIAADAPPGGQIFDQWTGDTGDVDNVLAETTTFTMPAADASVTATYQEPPVDGQVTVHGDLMQWHEVILDVTGPVSAEDATPNPFLEYRFNILFTGPSSQTYLVPGYFAGDGQGSDSGAVWRAHFNPDETGQWTYSVSFRQGPEIAVDLDPAAGTPLTAYDGLNGSFDVTVSDKSGEDFRAPEKGMLKNRGHQYLTYGGSGRPFLYTAPGIPENILGYRGFTNTTVGVGHDFTVHEADWNSGDPDWGNGAGRALIGALNFIADEGGNGLYMMSNTIGGDGKDVFMHLDPNNSKDRYDNLKLNQWAIALQHAQNRGIFLHWHLAEHESGNKTYYGSAAIPTLRKLYFRMLVARFGHFNGLKWNLMEETTWQDQDRRAMAAFLKAIDPYDHPLTFQLGGIGLNHSEYDLHLGETDFDSFSFQGSNSNNSMWNKIHSAIEASAAAGAPWTAAWDEPQKIENDLGDEVNGYPLGRYAKMWPCLMAGGDGFMWYIQKDGGGHGFDQRIEDFSIMGPAMNWSRYIREFLEPLPLLEMQATRDGLNEGLNSVSGPAYMLYQEGVVYAIYRAEGGSGITLDLSNQIGEFDVKWFDPRNGGFVTGTKLTVQGGSPVDLGSAPSAVNEDWAVLVQRPRRVAYIYGDVADDGSVPSGAADPYHQMLLTDTGNLGASMFQALVEAEGYQIDQFYDQTTTLDAAFLDQFDVLVFGLHQKIWSSAEVDALDVWIRAGGGLLIYSDSAAGGAFNIVGANNPVGQTVVNNLIGQYGMEVTVDQANGVKAYRAGSTATHPIVDGRPVLEGEGVSPVAVDPASAVERLIPYENDPEYKVSGDPTVNKQQNLTIQNPQFAALALARPGEGKVIAMFDRQPIWNNGPGSDIEEQDNTEILRRIILYLAGDLGEDPGTPVDQAPTAVAGANQSVEDTDKNGQATVTLNGSGSTDDNGIDTYSWQIGGTQIATGIQPMVDLGLGTYTLTLVVTDTAGNVDSDTVQIVVYQSIEGVVHAINSGGPALTSSIGINFNADSQNLNLFNGGNIYEDNSVAIGGTVDDLLFQSERYGGNFSYELPVAPGRYRLSLYFAEIFFDASGERVFGIEVEETPLASGIDLVVNPGADTARIITSNIDVTDNALSIAFSGTTDNAKISAIVVEGPLDGFGSWLTLELGEDASNPTLAAIDADPNLDGISNLLAYAADLPALGVNAVPVISEPVWDPGDLLDPTDDAFVFLYRRATGGADDVIYRVFVSSTLAEGSWTEVDFAQAENSLTILPDDPDGDGSAQLIEARVAVNGQEKLFGRLEVEQAP